MEDMAKVQSLLVVLVNFVSHIQVKEAATQRVLTSLDLFLSGARSQLQSLMSDAPLASTPTPVIKSEDVSTSTAVVTTNVESTSTATGDFDAAFGPATTTTTSDDNFEVSFD